MKVSEDCRSRKVGITIALTILTTLGTKPGPVLQVQIKSLCPKKTMCPLGPTEAFYTRAIKANGGEA